jgi:small GTP-binding protein
MFLLVVVGEFNSGKSAVINALLGDRIVEEGVTPTTSRIGLVKHGSAPGRAPGGGGFEVITQPVEILREITVVDTPGTNAVLRDHEALTREFVPRADLVLFVTSADRPFTESERAFLEAIHSWGKKVLVALNKIDILETPEDVAAVVDFVKEKALALLGLRPRIFPISARQARRAKVEGNEALLRASGFAALEDFVANTLHEALRVRLKLLNPLGVGLRVLGQAEGVVEQRATLLKEDSAVLEQIERQLALHREDAARGCRLRLGDVEKLLFDLERRAGDFVERAVRLGRMADIMQPERLRADFERVVVADLHRTVDKRVDEIAEWVAAGDAAHWEGIAEHVERRQAVHAGSAGQVGAPKHDRSRLSRDVRRDVQRTLETFDHRAEARRLSHGARQALMGTVLLQVGAVVLGVFVGMLSDAAVDEVSGMLIAAGLSATGFLLLPTYRRRARSSLVEKVGALREALVTRLKAAFDRELDQGRLRALEALGPYRRYVGSETERLRRQRDELAVMRGGFDSLKSRIESLGSVGASR